MAEVYEKRIDNLLEMKPFKIPDPSAAQRAASKARGYIADDLVRIRTNMYYYTYLEDGYSDEQKNTPKEKFKELYEKWDEELEIMKNDDIYVFFDNVGQYFKSRAREIINEKISEAKSKISSIKNNPDSYSITEEGSGPYSREVKNPIYSAAHMTQMENLEKDIETMEDAKSSL